MAVRVITEAFDPGAEHGRFLKRSAGAGAAVVFTGLVRSLPGEPVAALMLECYVDLALNEIGKLVEVATARFGLVDAEVIHRHGRLLPGEAIVQVMTLAPHRRAAFEAAEFLMDCLKTDAPFWKREERPDGPHWVESKSEDEAAKARWK